MDTLIVVVGMVTVAVALLVGAVIADRRLTRRMEQRMRGEEAPASGKPDAADTVIQVLDRMRDMVRQGLDEASESKGQGA
jgi:hypothetical protein